MCEPCRVARRDREREQYATRRTAGLCGRCGTPAPSDDACCDRCARSAAKRSRKKAKNARSRQLYVRRRVRAALHRLRRTIPRRVPVSPVRPPVLGAFGRASRSAGSATSSYGHRDRHGRQSRDMGPLGRCSGLPGLRQAFPGPGGADPGYVEHRPVSGAGVRKLVAARCARFREFAPLRLARPTPARTVQAAILGKCVATFHVLPDDSLDDTQYVCPATWTRHDPPASRCGPQSQGTAKPG